MAVEGNKTSVQSIINQLKHDDTQVREVAMGHLTVVAGALGPERTRNELLVFLKECTDDEDAVLEVLATQIGSLLEFIGGVEHAPLLLPNLEILLGVEQSKVREKAVESCKKIAHAISPESVQEHFYALLVRLKNAEWYTSHISLAALISTVYVHVSDENKGNLRTFYQELARSSTALVRRAASANLGVGFYFFLIFLRYFFLRYLL